MCLNCGLTYGCEPDCTPQAGPEAAGAKFETMPDGRKVAVPDMPMSNVDHPQHYGGEGDPYEVIKVMIAWDPQMAYHFCVGNAIKYFGRLGKKDPEKQVEELGKAGWYASKAAEIYTEHLSEESESKFIKAMEYQNSQVARTIAATSPPFGTHLGEGRD